jgi:carbonyl reductase 1
MTASRTALVTGANQGLGRALVEALAAGMEPQDRVLLTGRNTSAASLPSPTRSAPASPSARPASRSR